MAGDRRRLVLGSLVAVRFEMRQATVSGVARLLHNGSEISERLDGYWNEEGGLHG
jgi:hypothetical protein